MPAIKLSSHLFSSYHVSVATFTHREASSCLLFCSHPGPADAEYLEMFSHAISDSKGNGGGDR